MKVQTFLAIGGPLDGHHVAEDYAGDEYIRFNSSSGVSYKTIVVPSFRGDGRPFLTYARDSKGKKIVEYPKCVLIWCGTFTDGH